MNQVNPTSPEYMAVVRACKRVGVKVISPAAFVKASEQYGASALVQTAEMAVTCERSRQWIIALTSKTDSMTEGNSPPQEKKSWAPLTVHVYGSKAALCFEPTMSASKFPTVKVDAALKNQGGDERSFDWQNKTTLNLTREELVTVTTAMLGFIPQAAGQYHGPAKNKGFRVANQGQNFFFEMSEGNKPKKGIQVGVTDAYYVTNLLLRQLQNASPWMTIADVVNMLRARVPMFNHRN